VAPLLQCVGELAAYAFEFCALFDVLLNPKNLPQAPATDNVQPWHGISHSWKPHNILYKGKKKKTVRPLGYGKFPVLCANFNTCLGYTHFVCVFECVWFVCLSVCVLCVWCVCVWCVFECVWCVWCGVVYVWVCVCGCGVWVWFVCVWCVWVCVCCVYGVCVWCVWVWCVCGGGDFWLPFLLRVSLQYIRVV